MKKSVFLFCIQLLAAGCLAQYDTTSFKPVRTIRGDYTDFTIDNLGNLYVLTRNNQLKKLHPNGDSISIYNDVRRYGKVHAIDATNPLKLLLYYKDFGTIVVLDRLLNVRTTIGLRQYNLFQVKAVSQSYDNNIWLYDEQEARLKKLDEEGNLLTQFADFRQGMDVTPSPARIIDYDRQLYLYDPGTGWFIFDYFGTLKTRLPLMGWQDVQVVDNKLFGRKNGMLQQYQPGSLQLKEFPLGPRFAGADKIILSTSLLYCLKSGVIQVYSF